MEVFDYKGYGAIQGNSLETLSNDGGIDFVMKPLDRFLQVTETLDFKKYFLDIDKIQKFPISFIIKSVEPTEEISQNIKENASKIYSITAFMEKYMSCVEEVINLPILDLRFKETGKTRLSKQSS